MEELFKLAINGGVSFLLALVVVHWMRTDAKEREERMRKGQEERLRQEAERIEQYRLERKELIEVIRGNSEAMTELKNIIHQCPTGRGLI